MNPKYDIIIIGAGVAGALTAYKLCDKVKKDGTKPGILIIEAGENGLDDAQRTVFRDSFITSNGKGLSAPYFKLESLNFASIPDAIKKNAPNNYYVQTGPDQFKATFHKLTGGTTWAWRGNCPRMVPADFQLKSKYKIEGTEDWPFSYADIEPYYCQAEAELGVAGNHDEWNGEQMAFRSQPYPMDNIVQSYGDGKIKAALDGATIEGKFLKVVSTPQARISGKSNGVAITEYDNGGKQDKRPACKGNANCIPLCPIGAKYDAGVHLKILKTKPNITIETGKVVSRIALDKNGDAKEVFFIDWKTGTTTETLVKADIIILAGNAIETPRLLLNSGLANSSGLVGCNLMDHLAGEVVGLFPEPVYPFRGPQGTSTIPAFLDHPLRSEKGSFNITIGNDGWGRTEGPEVTLENLLKTGVFGAELITAFKNRIQRQIRFSYSTEMLPRKENRIKLSAQKDALGLPRPEISFTLDEYTKATLEYAREVVKEIVMNIDGVKEVKPLLPEPAANYNTAGHIMGTTKMGNDAKTSVVDKFGRCWDHKNIWIVGSGVFPTGGAVNPTITLAAVTLRTADELARNI